MEHLHPHTLWCSGCFHDFVVATSDPCFISLIDFLYLWTRKMVLGNWGGVSLCYVEKTCLHIRASPMHNAKHNFTITLPHEISLHVGATILNANDIFSRMASTLASSLEML